MKKHELPAELRGRNKNREMHLAAAYLRHQPYRAVEWTTALNWTKHGLPLAFRIAWQCMRVFNPSLPTYAPWNLSADQRQEREFRAKAILAWAQEPPSPELEQKMERALDKARDAREARYRVGLALHAHRHKQSA